ncbi:unnamed protein product [Schistocephalus solidus]|uniref:DUF5753 domain-containing protein n=1 Tax=Schistocephalus solidus TaxID=70667 RepID=A0A183TQY1_SCHSO|nr:unnamed protein product [Schistocephalus solidus]
MRIPTDAATVKRQHQPVMAATVAGQPRPSRLFYITDKSSGLRFLFDAGDELGPADIYSPLILAEAISMGEYTRALTKRLVTAYRLTADDIQTTQ